MQDKVNTNRDSDEDSVLYRHQTSNIVEEPEIHFEETAGSPYGSPKMAPQFPNKSLESTITLDKVDQIY